MKTVSFFVIAILILASPAAVLAGTYSYYFDYRSGGCKAIFGTLTLPNVGPGYDYETLNTVPFWPSQIALTIYKQNGKDGWDGPTGFYVTDYRSPLEPGQTDVIGDIYLWAGMEATPRDLQLWIYQSSLDPGLTYKLRLVSVPQGVNYTGPREWGPNHGTITLPFFATDDFTKGYMFRAEITAVPEPSSLLALAGGLAGLGGVLLRRRW